MRKPTRQWCLKGNVVNVENNIDKCVQVLPREFNECSVVELQLMRRMQYNGAYIHDKISPFKVLNALKHLIYAPLYVKENVTLNTNFTDSVTGKFKHNFSVNSW